jgi:photosystem II stability/assembly factor-like uncharacterized protein
MLSFRKIAAMMLMLMAIFCPSASSDINQWSTNGPYGASVKAIAIHPFDNQIIYIGTINNGIYKTTNGGESWAHVDCDNQFSCMRVIAIHPYAPDTIFVGSTLGIYRTNNGGITWNHVVTPSCPHNEIEAILIHPSQPNLIFAGGPVNEWMSTDGGRHWFRIEDIPLQYGIDEIALDMNNPDILYILISGLGSGEGIWKTTDRGWNWFNTHNNLDSAGNGTDIEIDPFNSNILYLSRFNPGFTSRVCLSKSTDAGESWFDITPPDMLNPYILQVKPSAFDSGVVFAGTSDEGLLKSSDGGMTWESKNDGLHMLQIPSILIDTISGIIYLGTYNDGIYKSTNNGENWLKISDNICVSHCSGLAVSTFNDSISYVSTENGLYRSTDIGLSWEYVEVGFPYYHAPAAVYLDNNNPSNVYIATTHFTFHPACPTGFYRSTDNGGSWQFFNNGLNANISYVDMAISYTDSEARRIFLASTNGVYFSDNLGESWILCENGLPVNSYFHVIKVAAGDNNIVAVGDDDNRVFISYNKGESWQETSELPTLPYSEILDLEFHPYDPDHLFVCSSRIGLLESTDAGQTWININNDLPVYQDYIIVSGPAINALNPLNMFVASDDYGVFQTHNGGQNWEAFNAGLDTSNGIGDLQFAPGDTNILYFAHSSKSVWTIQRIATGIYNEDAGILPENINLLQNYPNPFNASTIITYTLPQPGLISLDIYNLLGRKVESLFDGIQPSGEHSLIWNAEGLPSGVYFYKLTAGDFSETRKMILVR